MTPSLIILIDASTRLQQTTLLREYKGQIPLAIIRDISGIHKYGQKLDTAIIIDTRFTPAKLARYEQIKCIAHQSLILVFSDYADMVICQSAIAVHGHHDEVIPDCILTHILEHNALMHQCKPISSSTTHIKGDSSAMRDLYETVSLVAPTNFNLIIYGETGTGKEAMARMIHQLSRRKDKPFITIDCGCLNKETALSEFFGHVKGAFTDAVINKIGAFEQANGGTLFLDELANLPYDVQIALLRAVQEKEIRKLGSSNSIACDIRIIAATNEHLAEKFFRKDLYYRLDEMSLHLPPLRERGEDMILLAEFFLNEVCSELNISSKAFASCAKSKILKYGWPGNVRELKNVVKRSCLLAYNCSILNADMLQIGDCATVQATIDPQDGLKNTVQRAEYDQILTALKSVEFNKRKAAALLNIHRKTLYNKLKYMKEAFS